MPVGVERILFRFPAFQALEGRSEFGADICQGGVTGLSLNVTPSTESFPARLAGGNRVIGVVVGQFQDGSLARFAFEAD